MERSQGWEEEGRWFMGCGPTHHLKHPGTSRCLRILKLKLAFQVIMKVYLSRQEDIKYVIKQFVAWFILSICAYSTCASALGSTGVRVGLWAIIVEQYLVNKFFNLENIHIHLTQKVPVQKFMMWKYSYVI